MSSEENDAARASMSGGACRGAGAGAEPEPMPGTTVAVCSVRAGGTVSRSLYTTASHRGTVLLPLPRWSRNMSCLRTLNALSPPKR